MTYNLVDVKKEIYNIKKGLSNNEDIIPILKDALYIGREVLENFTERSSDVIYTSIQGLHKELSDSKKMKPAKYKKRISDLITNIESLIEKE